MEKIMNENFKLLKERILDTNKITDIESIRNILNNIKGNTMCVGAGGSKVVAEFATKVISKMSEDIVICLEFRDTNYINLSKYKNIFISCYSGSNKTLNIIKKDNNIKKYLLTNYDKKRRGFESLIYKSSIETEKSFISLASTLMPMSILLRIYLGISMKAFEKLINEMFENIEVNIKGNKVYEIMGGIENKTVISYLESTLIESGIAMPIIHDKYSYCHGRSTTTYKLNNDLIYLGYNESDLDKTLIKETSLYYSEVIRIDSIFEDELVNEFYMTLKAMYFTKALATIYKEDLSGVNHGLITRKVYNFKGSV